MPEAIPLQYVGAASELFTETTLHYLDFVEEEEWFDEKLRTRASSA